MVTKNAAGGVFAEGPPDDVSENSDIFNVEVDPCEKENEIRPEANKMVPGTLWQASLRAGRCQDAER